MNKPSQMLRASLLTCAAALAAQGIARADQIDDNYRKERAACLNGTTTQVKSACLKEASAARYAARHGQLTTPSPQTLAQNTMRRCQLQPLQDRDDCARRMNGEGVIEGSVAQGAILRESTSITIHPAAGPSAPATPAASQPRR